MTRTPLDPEVLQRAGLHLEVNGLVATITLDRPETRNSQTPATWLALRVIGASLDPSVRVVVLRGRGETFSSGLDRRMLTPEGVDGESLLTLLEMPDGELADTIAGYQEGFTWLRRSDVITIAAVRGHAIVMPGEELDWTVHDLVAALTAPLYGAVSETKSLLQSAAALDLEEQRKLEREAQVRRFRELASLMGEG